MDTIVNRRVQAARSGENPTVVRRMPSGWAVLADWQGLPGYVILLADPVVGDLNALAGPQRQRFLKDMTLIGDALMEVTDATRINYQILGNLDPVLHAHICPRYAWEPDALRRASTAHYDKSGDPRFDVEKHRELMRKIGEALDRLRGQG